MKRTVTALATATVLIAALAGCGTTPGDRAVSGAGIGAAAGAVGGAVIGGDPLAGAVIGGAVGAGVGAATTPPPN